MVWMETLGCMVYLCSPKLRSLQELEERGLHISDIAQHDTTRDLILLNQQRLAEMELSNQLERKKADTTSCLESIALYICRVEYESIALYICRVEYVYRTFYL